MSAEGGGTRMARPRAESRGKTQDPPAPERVDRAPDAVPTGEWHPSRALRAKVLFLVANSSAAPVNAEVEEREIQDALGGKRFVFEKVPDVRAEDLFRVMRDQRPAIVHFSGHGHGADGLAMKNRDGKPTGITARELGLHFKDLAAQGIAVRVVVLNACLAEAQAKAIAPYVDYVVGTSTLVGDETAVTFAANFYLAIAEGRPVRAAFEAARARCGGEVEGSERIFRLFYSEPAAPVKPRWAPFALAGAALLLAVGAWLTLGGNGEVTMTGADAATASALPLDAAPPPPRPEPDAAPPDPAPRPPEPDAAPPDAPAAPATGDRVIRRTRPARRVTARICVRDLSAGLNRVVPRADCCVGPQPVTPSQQSVITADLGRCTSVRACASVKASCR